MAGAAPKILGGAASQAAADAVEAFKNCRRERAHGMANILASFRIPSVSTDILSPSYRRGRHKESPGAAVSYNPFVEHLEKLKEKLKELTREIVGVDWTDDEDEGSDPSMVAARLKPRPRPGVSAIALTEPD